MKIPRFDDTQGVYSILDGLQIRAAAFIREHDGAHLDRRQLIERTIAHIKSMTDVADSTAERVTVRALTEYEARGQACYIDVDETTAYHVAVRDPYTKALRVITVVELMRMLREADGLKALPTPSKRAACAGQFLNT